MIHDFNIKSYTLEQNEKRLRECSAIHAIQADPFPEGKILHCFQDWKHLQKHALKLITWPNWAGLKRVWSHQVGHALSNIDVPGRAPLNLKVAVREDWMTCNTAFCQYTEAEVLPRLSEIYIRIPKWWPASFNWADQSTIALIKLVHTRID